MKSTIAIAAISGALLTAAQSADTIPACGQTCLDNMAQVMQSTYGCAAGDQACYCSEANYGYGIRDCTNQFCGDANLALQSLYFGAQLCANQPSAADSEDSFGSATNGTETALPTVSGSPSGQPSATATSALVTTIVSGDSTLVSTTGSTTLLGAVSSGVSTSETTGTDASGSTTTGTTTGSSTSTIRTATVSTESSSSEGAAAAMKTQAPLLGAVALAAMALL